MQEIKFINLKSQLREKQQNKHFENKSFKYCHWSSQLIQLVFSRYNLCYVYIFLN